MPTRLTLRSRSSEPTNESAAPGFLVLMARPPPPTTKRLIGHVLVGMRRGLSTITLFECVVGCAVDTVHNLLSVDTIHATPLMHHAATLHFGHHPLNDVWLSTISRPWGSAYTSVISVAPSNFLQVVHRLITSDKLSCFWRYWPCLHINIPAGLRWLLFTQHFSCNDTKRRVLIKLPGNKCAML
jgi:hypothetical protein